jgi:hypothetical protein
MIKELTETCQKEICVLGIYFLSSLVIRLLSCIPRNIVNWLVLSNNDERNKKTYYLLRETRCQRVSSLFFPSPLPFKLLSPYRIVAPFLRYILSDRRTPSNVVSKLVIGNRKKNYGPRRCGRVSSPFYSFITSLSHLVHLVIYEISK